MTCGGKNNAIVRIRHKQAPLCFEKKKKYLCNRNQLIFIERENHTASAMIQD